MHLMIENTLSLVRATIRWLLLLLLTRLFIVYWLFNHRTIVALGYEIGSNLSVIPPDSDQRCFVPITPNLFYVHRYGQGGQFLEIDFCHKVLGQQEIREGSQSGKSGVPLLCHLTTFLVIHVLPTSWLQKFVFNLLGIAFRRLMCVNVLFVFKFFFWSERGAYHKI